MAGKEDRIVKCLRCYTCMAERPVTFTRRCAVNPLIGREIEGMEVLPARQSKKVMVVGGGLAGCECAIHLGMEGKKVELVEMRDTLAADCNIRQRPILMRKVAEFSTAHTEYTGQKITADGVVCKDKEGHEVLVPGKTVICALGQHANRADVDTLRGCAPFVREVGDCVRPANITKAIYEAYHAALDI